MLSGGAASGKEPLMSRWEHREGGLQLQPQDEFVMCDISLGTVITEEGGSGTVGVPGGNSLESLPLQTILDWARL